jgi:hypothetical protein
MRRAILLGVIGWVTFEVMGCATVFNGSRQNIIVTSSPDMAKVTASPVAGDYNTPTTLNLERKNDYVLTFSKEGYSSTTAQISHHVRGGIVVLDVILGGLIGVVVDAATGAWNKLSPETVNVSLTKTAAIDGPDRIDVGLRVEQSQNQDRVRIQSSDPGVLVHVQKR